MTHNADLNLKATSTHGETELLHVSTLANCDALLAVINLNASIQDASCLNLSSPSFETFEPFYVVVEDTTNVITVLLKETQSSREFMTAQMTSINASSASIYRYGFSNH